MDNFDIMAEDFDTVERVNRAKAIADKIQVHIHEGNKKSAVEYGCGTGLVGFQLINRFKTILFVDSSPEMIKQVTRKLEKLNNPAASTLCSDLIGDVSKKLRADYIFLSLVLHHIKDTKAALQRFYDMLHDGGRLLIVDVDEEDGSFHAKYPDFDGHNGFSHSFIVDAALKTGFETATIETFYNDTKVFEGKKNPYSLFILDAVKR